MKPPPPRRGGLFIYLDLSLPLVYNLPVGDFSFKQHIGDVTIAVIDLETTGLDPAAGDEICEMAVVFIRNLTASGEWSSLVRISSPMPAEALAIHGIDDAMLADAPPLGEVISRFRVLTDGCAYLIQNAPFDMAFLQMGMNSLREPELEAPVLDFLNIARRLLPNLDNYKLATICEHLNLLLESFHRALGDARQTAQAFLSLIDVLNLQDKTLAEFLELSRPIEKPQLPLVEDAIRRKERILIEYEDGKGEVTRRLIRPLGYTRDNLSLIAYCELREQKRTFKLNRIKSYSTHEEEGE